MQPFSLTPSVNPAFGGKRSAAGSNDAKPLRVPQTPMTDRQTTDYVELTSSTQLAGSSRVYRNNGSNMNECLVKRQVSWPRGGTCSGKEGGYGEIDSILYSGKFPRAKNALDTAGVTWQGHHLYAGTRPENGLMPFLPLRRSQAPQW